MAETFFKQVTLPYLQRSVNGVAFPTVLFPNPDYINDGAAQVSHLTEAIQAQKLWLESLLNQTGVVLLRGFPVSSPSDFNQVIEAFGFPEMPYVGGGAVRAAVVGRVLTANESPPEQRIHFHSELAHSTNYPRILFFYCDEKPGSGGETAVVPGDVVYDRMKERYPEFVEKLEKLGVIYTKPLLEEDDSENPVGRSWKSFFTTDDKKVADQRAAEAGIKLEWQENVAILKTDPRAVIKFDEESGRKFWFSGMAITYGSPDSVEMFGPNAMPTFGNGEPLPADIMFDSAKIMDEEMVTVPWEKGDVLLVHNFKVLHSRMPLIKPPRRILASFSK